MFEGRFVAIAWQKSGLRSLYNGVKAGQEEKRQNVYKIDACVERLNPQTRIKYGVVGCSTPGAE
jgi:hypothetical protein